MAVTLVQKRLKAIGCDWDVLEFQKFIDAEFRSIHPKWTLDELLVHPLDAHAFCELIRESGEAGNPPDDLILRSLLAYRKRFNRSKRSSI